MMMIMQYQFALPAQFDMSTIRQRIKENGHKLNGFPHLGFKAYLFQEQDGDDIYQRENRYAPFYFWNASEGMRDFLASGGYQNVEQTFGRPEVCTYLPFVHKQKMALGDTQYAWVSKEHVSRDTNIQTLLEQQQMLANKFTHPEMTAYVVALDTKTWHLHTWLFFRSRVELNELAQLDTNSIIELSTYQVGYVAE